MSCALNEQHDALRKPRDNTETPTASCVRGLVKGDAAAENPPAGQPFFGPDPESSPLVPGRPWDLRRMSRTTMTMIATPPTDSSTHIGGDMPESPPARHPSPPRRSGSVR